jgi:hypothetical protein
MRDWGAWSVNIEYDVLRIMSKLASFGFQTLGEYMAAGVRNQPQENFFKVAAIAFLRPKT